MTNVVHTEPINDLIEHSDSEDCICGPTVEVVFREDGSNGWHVLHHSLDGREHYEYNHDHKSCLACVQRNQNENI